MNGPKVAKFLVW